MTAVAIFDGKDCWRTWFWVECENSGMFGVTSAYIQRIAQGNPSIGLPPYDVNTVIYLEDAPYFAQNKLQHLIHGPYVVVSGSLPSNCSVNHITSNGLIMWYDPNPRTSGPWLDRLNVNRIIQGLSCNFNQFASHYSFYPYRFRIRRDTTTFASVLVAHNKNCALCT